MARDDTGTKSFNASEALVIHRLVKLNGSTARSVAYADAGDIAIGCTFKGVASGKEVAVWLLASKPGTITCEAAGAITVNALVYTAGSGKVSTTVTGLPVGRSLQTASTDGDHVEVLVSLHHDVLGSLAGAHSISDDFDYYVTGDLWTGIHTNSGTATVGDGGVGGILALAADGGGAGDNDESYLSQTKETFLFAQNKPLWFEARVALTEANTNDANVIVGLMDAWAANSILDNGGGPSASYSGAVFFKVDGGTVWQAECSIAGTQTAVTLDTDTWTGNGTYQRMGIEFIPTSASASTVNFYIDGVLAGTTSFTYTSATHMEAGVGVKNGDTNAEVLNIDYITCSQTR